MTRRSSAVALIVLMLAGVAIAGQARFTSVWTPPGLKALSFDGQTVVGLVISEDLSLRMSGEEALATELTARGLRGVAAYRVIPREELRNAESAKGWFERAGASGVVAMRLIDLTKESTPASVIWSSAPYTSFWDYYPYSWGNTFTIVPGSTDTKAVIETLVYDLADNRLIWAGTSESFNPQNVHALVVGIVNATADEMRKRGLTRR